ncbi:MAG: hypothetical protein QM768_11145 [Agriterribacter sp.]
MLYEKALLEKWDAYAVKKTAEEKIKTAKEKIRKEMMEGLAKARKESMEKGMERGMERGIKKGRAEGMEKSKEQLIKNLISNFGFTDEQAASATEMSLSFVKKIRASLKKKK